MLSFWEKREFTQWDHLIIGGGIVGLSTAASLLEAQPGAKVVVLERGSLPTGASTKNAGFACFGSLTELAVDRSQLPDEEVLQLVESRWNGLKRLRSRLGETALRYEACGGYEMITEAELSYLDQLEAVNELLSPLFGEQVFSMADEKIGAFGFDRKEVPHLISNPFEGQLDPAAMIHALWRYVIERGGTVLTGCEVMGWEEGPKGCQVRARVQAQPEQLAFHAQQLAICTNAFTTALLPDLELQPGRGQVLITEPIPDWPLRGVFHYQEGYYYF
ncbi:MAG: FAD-dependent oxidoreductase, partial [Bacteroidota bacterium]